MRSLIQLCVLLFCSSCIGFAQELKFDMPLKGMPGRDFFIDYYVDHDPSDGLRDPFCGTKTYNGHKGTDMLLRSFKTMDSGVYVYAAADGIVIDVRDGIYDRMKHWESGRVANHIAIKHRNGYTTFYEHLMKNSLLVKIGDSVKAGQPMAKVGSSGFSCYPHLHFEVRDRSNRIVDPFSGSCQAGTSGLWVSQPPYDTGVYSIENGFVPYLPGFDTLLERYLVNDTFYLDKDTTVCFWLLMHGLRSGDNTHVEWYTPSGREWFTYNFKWKSNWWYDYTWFRIKMPTIQGRWTVMYHVNDVFITSRYFYILRRKGR